VIDVAPQTRSSSGPTAHVTNEAGRIIKQIDDDAENPEDFGAPCMTRKPGHAEHVTKLATKNSKAPLACMLRRSQRN